jgi:hypothetical protein
MDIDSSTSWPRWGVNIGFRQPLADIKLRGCAADPDRAKHTPNKGNPPLDHDFGTG